MRHLIIADVHGDYDALQGALAKGRQQGGFDDIWFLGDAVGRGSESARCVQALRESDAICIRGNWERWLLSPAEPLATVHGPEIAALRESVGSHLLDYIAEWPRVRSLDGFTLVHGSPVLPRERDFRHVEVAYMHYHDEVERAFELNAVQVQPQLELSKNFAYAHTHQARLWSCCLKGCGVTCRPIVPLPEEPWPLPQRDCRIALNPGSLGNPRPTSSTWEVRAGPAMGALYDSHEQSVWFFEIM